MIAKSTLFLICLLHITMPASAAEPANRITVTTPSSANYSAPMTVSSDSKMVQELLRKHKPQNRNKLQSQVSSRRSVADTVGKNRRQPDKNNKASEPKIIHLENAENQPAVVNTTKTFIFRDITSRGGDAAGHQADMAQREINIESLRQAAARR